jgi:hypothetical protein
VIKQLDELSREYQFTTIDATRPVDEISDLLAGHVARQLLLGRRATGGPILAR